MPEVFLHSMQKFAGQLALVDHGNASTYRDVLDRVKHWHGLLAKYRIAPGSVVAIEAEYGIDAVAAVLALADRRAILVPLSRDAAAQHEKFRAIAQVQHRVIIEGTTPRIVDTGMTADHPLYQQLRADNAPGLVLFSSGSTGESKAIVHDLGRLLKKFRTQRRGYRTLVFLQFDHIGGINTLLYSLSNGGAIIVPRDRSPGCVCATIAEHKAELLPTSPTFLNLLLLSEEHTRHDVSSLQLITYGTEPMPESTLARAAQAFPQIELRQTYGLSELGILRSKSQNSRSLWVRVGGDGYETRVKDGRLWIRAEAAMLGYLNAPSPFDAEGFFDTGDQVDVAGDWMRIRGRVTDIINVGGNKVYPAEVESVLQELDNVADASVRAEHNPITGQVVAVNIRLRVPEEANAFKARMRNHCKDRLPTFAVPARVRFSDEPLHTTRFKRAH